MTEPNRQSGEKEERIIEIEIERLRPFKEHPFQVKDDKEMFLLQESIEKYGILNPLIVRPVPDDSFLKKVSRSMINKWADKGKFTVIKVGSRVRIRRDEFEDWMEQRDLERSMQ